MTDIVRLGLAIDSGPVTAASAALDKFQASANTAAAGADKLQAATKTTGSNVAVVAKSAEVAAKGMDKVAKSTGLARHEMINLSRQLQDVGVSLAGGQSPFTVLFQQGSQIADIFGSSKTGTVGGALRQIGSTITGVLTPMRLLGGGAALLAVGFAAAASSIIKSELALDDFARSTDLSLTKIHALQQSASFKGIGNDDFQKGITGFADGVYQAQRNFGSLNSLMIANGKNAKDLNGYLGNVADLVARATSDMEKQKILREAGLPSDAAWVRYMEQGSKGIQAALDGSVKFNESAELNLIRKAREFDDAWNKATTNMVNYFKSGVVDITAALASIKVPDWLKTAADKALSISPLTAGAYSIAKTAAGAMSSDPTFADRFGSFEKPLNSNRLQGGLNQRAGIKEPTTAAERLIDIGKAQQTLSLLGNLATVEDQVKSKSLELDAAYIQNGVGVGKMRDAVLNAVRAQADMNSIQERAQYGYFNAAQGAKYLQEQLSFLASKGALDPNNAQAMAGAVNSLTKQMEDLNDQAKVAGSLLPQFQQALNDAGSARKQLDSLMVEGMSVNRGFFVEFGQQLRQGASAWDAFKSAGLNALGKIADKLMQMAADKLFASAFGGSSGGIASLFGLGGGGGGAMSFGGDLGAGTGGMAFPMFANGGYTGAGGKYQPAGVVHKGEYVMDAVTVRRVGVANLDSLRGYADGGMVGNMARAARGQGGGPAVVMQDNRQISIGQGASAETVLQLREELARDRAARYSDTVKIVQSAKKRRDL